MQARKRIILPISSAKRLLPFLPLITALVLSLFGGAAPATATMLSTSLPTSESGRPSLPERPSRLAQRSDPGYQAGRYALMAGGGPPLGNGSVWVLVLEDGVLRIWLTP